jgi:hypothetical protein
VRISRGLALIFVGAAIAALPSVFAEKLDPTTICLTWAGVCLSIFGGILQEIDSKPYLFEFTTDHWQSSSNGYFISISENKHRKGCAGIVEVSMLNTTGYYEVCICGVHFSDSGDSKIIIDGPPFSGKIVIS